MPLADAIFNCTIVLGCGKLKPRSLDATPESARSTWPTELLLHALVNVPIL
jgi:hypothetical protein